jgi:DNA-binding transcriptional MerR regulator
MTRQITSKEIVASLGISYPSLTHYTNIGLFKVIGKKNRQRLYDCEDTKKRLGMINDLIAKGYPLRLIKEKLDNELL